MAAGLTIPSFFITHHFFLSIRHIHFECILGMAMPIFLYQWLDETNKERPKYLVFQKGYTTVK
jgi:hypothetical protein